MSGAFLIEGMGFRIPAGGLVIAKDGKHTVTFETRYDVYPALIDAAIDHVESAEENNLRLLTAAKAGDSELKAQALTDELKDVVVAITTSAFALEAFQARAADVIEIPDDLRQAWINNKTRMKGRIIETLKRGVDLPGAKWDQLDHEVGQVFKFRNFAAHPASGYQVPAIHPDLGEGVDPALMIFRLFNGRAAALIALRTIHLCLQNPKPKDVITDWMREALGFVEPLAERWEARFGPLWAPDALVDKVLE